MKKISFTQKSGWLPSTSKVDTEIIKCYENIMKKVGEMKDYMYHQNMSVMERRPLKKLHKNRKIVIKPADKGSATVILSKSQTMKFYLLSKIHKPVNTWTYSSGVGRCQKVGGHTDTQFMYLR